jgi:hypothetical protein
MFALRCEECMSKRNFELRNPEALKNDAERKSQTYWRKSRKTKKFAANAFRPIDFVFSSNWYKTFPMFLTIMKCSFRDPLEESRNLSFLRNWRNIFSWRLSLRNSRTQCKKREIDCRQVLLRHVGKSICSKARHRQMIRYIELFDNAYPVSNRSHFDITVPTNDIIQNLGPVVKIF